MKKKRLLALALALLFLGGCSFLPPLRQAAETTAPAESELPSPEPTGSTRETTVVIPDDGKYTLRYVPEDSLNPYSCSTEANRLLAPLMYEPLIGITPDFQPEGILCTDWSSEEGGTVFVLRLREDVLFSDGTALTAWDAAYSLNRAREETSFYAGRLRNLKEVSVEGNFLRLTLGSPMPSFPLRLDIPVVKEGTAYRDVPTGTGPYLFSGEEEACLAVNPWGRFSDDLPFSRAELRRFAQEEAPAALAAGTLDLLVGEAGAGNAPVPEGAVRRNLPTSILYYLGLNPRCEALSDPARRRLVNAVIDRGSLSALLGGDAALLPLHPVLPDYDDSEAKQWIPADLKDYGIGILTEDYDGDGTLEYFSDGMPTPFSFRLLTCSENETAAAAARSIADSLRNQGIHAELRLLNKSDFLRAVRAGDYDMYLASMRLTADFDLTALYQNLGDDLLRRLAEAYSASEGDARREAASALGAYSAECALVLPLVFLRRAVIYPQNSVEGMEPTWTNPFRNIQNWQIRANLTEDSQ